MGRRRPPPSAPICRKQTPPEKTNNTRIRLMCAVLRLPHLTVTTRCVTQAPSHYYPTRLNRSAISGPPTAASPSPPPPPSLLPPPPPKNAARTASASDS
jgi:hypothetical protein